MRNCDLIKSSLKHHKQKDIHKILIHYHMELVPGGRLNKKDRLTGYGDPHVKDKTSYRPSYL